MSTRSHIAILMFVFLGQPTIKEKAQIFIEALDLGLSTLPTTTTNPPTTQPLWLPEQRLNLHPLSHLLATRETTKPPTTQPPTTRATINPPSATASYTYPPGPAGISPKCYHVHRHAAVRAAVNVTIKTPSCTTTPSKRQIQHCPTDVHKICGSDNSMCLNLKLFNQVVS